MKLADLKARLATAAQRSRTPAVDLVGLVGAGLVVAGVDLISRPAALILAGLALVVCAFLLQRRQP
jgi:hypothetical protein